MRQNYIAGLLCGALICAGIGCDGKPDTNSDATGNSDRQVRAEIEAKVRAEMEAKSRADENAKVNTAAKDVQAKQEMRRLVASFPIWAKSVSEKVAERWNKEETDPKMDGMRSWARYKVGDHRADVRKSDSVLTPIIGELRIPYTIEIEVTLYIDETTSRTVYSGQVVAEFEPEEAGWKLVRARYQGDRQKTDRPVGTGAIRSSGVVETEHFDEDYTERLAKIVVECGGQAPASHSDKGKISR